MDIQDIMDIDEPGLLRQYPQAHLLGIPIELFEEIADYIEPHDLMSLRLVNRAAAHKILQTYAEVCCKQITLQINRTPFLAMARNMIENPAFNRAIRKIIIDTDDLRIFQLKDNARSSYLREFLKTLGTVPERKIAIEVRQLRLPQFGHKDIDQNKLGFRMHNVLDYIDPLLDVARACRKSNLRIHKFTIGKDAWLIPAHKISDHWLELQTGLFTFLTHLDLGTWTADLEGSTDLADLVATATQLKSLSVRSIYEFNERVMHSDVEPLDFTSFVSRLSTFRFAHLEALHLDGHFFDLPDLLDFVHNHPTMKSLTLEHCGVGEVREILDDEDEDLSDAIERLIEVDDISLENVDWNPDF